MSGLAQLLRTHSVVQAQVLQSALDAAGVGAAIFDDSMLTAFSPFLTGGVRVMVHEDDLAAAQRILKEMEAAARAADAADNESDPI